jgi:cell division septum initiation protein DivIVA
MVHMDFEERLRQMDVLHDRHIERMRELTDEMAETRLEFKDALSDTRRELTETLVVVSGIQSRQAAVQRGQAEWLEALQKSEELHRERMALFDQKMLEIEEKLNALIGVVDGMQQKPPASPAS